MRTMLEYFGKHSPSLAENMPASTGVGVNGLQFPATLVEIDVEALIP